MKIRIVPDAEVYGKEDPAAVREEIEAREDAGLIRNSEDHPEQFKKDMLQAKEVVIPQSVYDRMIKMGLTPDEIVAMMLKSAGAEQ
jgi:hypothetical protein